MINDETFNEGMYADQKVAEEWVNWTKKFKIEDTRNLDIYPYLSKWIGENKPKTVLEIGSGSGLCVAHVNLPGITYVGVEPSLHLRELARKTYPHVRFEAGKAEDIPLESNTIDAAFSVFVWLHIKDLDLASKELSRVLKPGARFVIVDINPDSHDLWLSWHTNLKRDGKEVRGDMKYLSNHHMFLHTMEEITGSLKTNNLDIDDISYCGKPGTLHDNPNIKFAMILSGHKSA